VTDSENAESSFLRAFARAVEEVRRQRGVSEAELDALGDDGRTDPGTLIALGAAVSELRTRADLSVKELAARTALPVEYIEALEAGLAHPRLATVAAIATAIGVPLSDLAVRAEELEGGDGRWSPR
jgi:ribosome-binding protein aMBF1 (putative translation factor)